MSALEKPFHEIASLSIMQAMENDRSLDRVDSI